MAKYSERKQYPKPWGICVTDCYVLHLYCAEDGHGYKQGSEEFSGPTKARTFAEAKKAGWVIKENEDIAICPIHAKEETK